MNPLQRKPADPWFDKEHEDLCKAAGLSWQEKLKCQPKSQFSWYLKGLGNIRQKTFLPALLDMTKHCAFCDAYEMGPDIQATVEHFRPKIEYPQLAFQWINLYLCCANCQVKGKHFEPSLLRPDDKGYQFERYFSIDLRTGEVKPKVSATPEDQKRAETTIRLYRLNSNGKPGARISRWRFYKSNYDRAQKEAEREKKPFNLAQYKELRHRSNRVTL
jgi:uncharacterized protein (TIGR02646 family)